MFRYIERNTGTGEIIRVAEEHGKMAMDATATGRRNGAGVGE
jgi:hypothetical protein